MAHPQPPVPPDQQSDIIRDESSPPDRKPEVKIDPGHDAHGDSAESRGDEANRNQNLQPSHNQR